jgi:hypothetical protein
LTLFNLFFGGHYLVSREWLELFSSLDQERTRKLQKPITAIPEIAAEPFPDPGSRTVSPRNHFPPKAYSVASYYIGRSPQRA